MTETTQSSIIKNISLYVMAILYTAAGVMHFINPGFYLKIMPPYLPWHLELVYISGAIEVFLGMALLIKNLRHLAAWGIILLLLAVFPANFYQFTSGGAGMQVPDWALIMRLLFQIVLIAWAYWHTRKP